MSKRVSYSQGNENCRLTQFNIVFSNYQSAQIKAFSFQHDFSSIEFHKLNFLTSMSSY